MNVLHSIRRAPLYAFALLLAVIVVPPTHDFPLNDDWVYATMVRWHLDGHFAVHPYSSAFAFSQTIWGALWSLVLGYSYTTLRVSTLALAVLAAWAVAQSAREAGASRWASRCAGLVLVANPIFLNLAYTFMTDVPFIACLALSVLFHLRLLRRASAKTAVGASLLATAAFLDRQFGLLIPVAFTLALAMTWRRIYLRDSICISLAYIAPWLVAIPIALWLTYTQDMVFYPSEAVSGLRTPDAAMTLVFATITTLTLGLFLLPVTLPTPLRWSRRRAYVFACTLGLMLGMLPLLGPLPLFPNILRDFGVGPLLLRDATVFNRDWSPFRAGPLFWWPLTVLAALSAAFFVASQIAMRHKARRVHRIRTTQRFFLLVLALLLIVAPAIPAHSVYFDRYLLPTFALLLILAAAPRSARIASPSSRSRKATLILCALSYAFSIVSLQDYLAWNRARWQAVDVLRVVHNVPDTQIDGGYEFNGIYTSDAYMARLRAGEDLGGRGWWVVDDAYAVSFLPRDGYEEIDRVAYTSWLGFTQRHILILKRKADSLSN
ncbi:MAG: glycosyltransferase family 39 protein [Candidatus Hydrogenedentes bacterium]|nr:glycosyltransferase family 39 protein [Candidatus Hydrogenedentota bacterium]